MVWVGYIRKNGPGPEADSAGLKRAQSSQTLKSFKSYCPISNALKTLLRGEARTQTTDHKMTVRDKVK